MTDSTPPEAGPQELPPQPDGDDAGPAEPLDPAQQPAAGGSAGGTPVQGDGAGDSH